MTGVNKTIKYWS